MDTDDAVRSTRGNLTIVEKTHHTEVCVGLQVMALQPWQQLRVAFSGRPDKVKAKLKDAMSQLQRQKAQGHRLTKEEQRLWDVLNSGAGLTD